MLKTCNKCLKEKSINLFYKDKSKLDGLTTICKNCKNISNLMWQKLHPDAVNKSKEKYRKNNPEKTRQAISNWQKNNPEAVANKSHKRRAKIKNGSCHVDKKELQKLYGSSCLYCGSTESITIDHIVPISRGGIHAIGNLAPACAFCNSSKGTKTLTEWRKFNKRFSGIKPRVFP